MADAVAEAETLNFVVIFEVVDLVWELGSKGVKELQTDDVDVGA